MQFFTLASLALFSGAAMAAPAAAGQDQLETRTVYPTIPVTFNAAADVSFTLYISGNSVPVNIYQDLSITSISMEGRASFACTAYGKDGSVTSLYASQQNVPVGPPQVQTSIVCSAPAY